MLRIRFLLPLVVLALLVVSQPIGAFADAEGALPSDAAIQTTEEEDETEAEEECAAAEDEEAESSEEAEEECEAEAEDAGFSPADCYLHTARARVVAYPGRQTMRLTLGYTTYTPAAATVQYGAKKEPHLGTVHRQLGRSGVLRLSKHLAGKQMAKVATSSRFTVIVHIPEAPRACQRFEVQKLQVDQSSDSRVTWSEDR